MIGIRSYHGDNNDFLLSTLKPIDSRDLYPCDSVTSHHALVVKLGAVPDCLLDHVYLSIIRCDDTYMWLRDTIG